MPAYSTDSGFTGSGSAYSSKPTTAKTATSKASAPNAAASYAAKALASKPTTTAKASVNAAAANASKMLSAKSAQTSNLAAKTSLPSSTKQSVSKGINYSAADYLSAGYGAYKNPKATQSIVNKSGAQIASLAPPNTTTVHKSPSSPATGWQQLAGLQNAVSGGYPSMGNIVAGTTPGAYGNVTTNGEIGSADLGQILNNAGYGKAPSQIAKYSYSSKPTQVATSTEVPYTESYWGNKSQLPAGAYAQIQGKGTGQQSVASLTSPMAGQGATFSGPKSASQYNMAMGKALASNNTTAQPASAQVAADNSLYGEAPQAPPMKDKIAAALMGKFTKIASPAQKIGNAVNGMMGGSPYNDLYGTASQTNANARDPLNSEAEKIKELVAAAKSGDTSAAQTLKAWFEWKQWPVGPRPANV